MRVFVTGASGFVGSAVVKELINAGHQVLGLARSDASAQKLKDAGAEVHRGDVEDLESLKSGAAAVDGVIHTAFNHDFSRFKQNCEDDRKAIEALGSVLIGTDKPLIITSGSAVKSDGSLVTEDSAPPSSDVMPRAASEEAAAELRAKGVKVAVMRLPPSVHGDGDHGFVPMLIDLAKQKGIAAYVGEGNNRWPSVHRFDAANLYRLVLEAGAAESHYIAAAEEGTPMREIATVIGQHLNIPVISKSKEEAAEHFGWFTHFASIDTPASSAKTRQWLGWNPTGITLLEDMAAHYFKG